ncbi:MAG: hypothetical protein Q8N22_02510 [bacterium]|nr:hypothetical protein [bacterium]
MVKKLNSLFASKLWKSVLLKSSLIGFGLFGIYFFNFSFSAFLFFSFLMAGIYFSQLPERGQFRISFLVLTLTALLAFYFFADSFYLAFFGCLIFSFLFYLLLGLTDFIFENRRAVYLFFNTCLFLAVFSLFFGADKSKHFLLINALLFSAIFLLFKECFGFLRSASHRLPFIVHNPRFISLVFSFLGLELFWAINLLPIGFINSAILLTLFVFLMRDFVLIYFSGRLNRRFFANHFLIFIILVIFIFANSKWSI